MQNIIAVFNNRNQALQFATALKRMGIGNRTMDTPRDLSKSCGISIVFDGRFLNRARLIIDKLRMQPNVKLYIISGDKFKRYQLIR